MHPTTDGEAGSDKNDREVTVKKLNRGEKSTAGDPVTSKIGSPKRGETVGGV